MASRIVSMPTYFLWYRQSDGERLRWSSLQGFTHWFRNKEYLSNLLPDVLLGDKVRAIQDCLTMTVDIFIDNARRTTDKHLNQAESYCDFSKICVTKAKTVQDKQRGV